MDSINYESLLDRAMYTIVRNSLQNIVDDTAPGEHYFFITFDTTNPDVKLSLKLRNSHPKEMTIVLQHQFENLEVSEEGFSVTLSFSGVKEDLYIPFTSLRTFADPSVKFGLQFNSSAPKTDRDTDSSVEEIPQKTSKEVNTASAMTFDNVISLHDLKK